MKIPGIAQTELTIKDFKEDARGSFMNMAAVNAKRLKNRQKHKHKDADSKRFIQNRADVTIFRFRSRRAVDKVMDSFY